MYFVARRSVERSRKGFSEMELGVPERGSRPSERDRHWALPVQPHQVAKKDEQNEYTCAHCNADL